MTDGLLAVDWGTSNRRVFRLAAGAIDTIEQDGLGATNLRAEDYPGEVAAIRGRLGDLPMLVAGMAGADIGWTRVPYVPVPVDLEALARELHWIDDRTAIVPGVCDPHPDRADVMRGEEVQVLGACAAGMVPPDALLCQPGTHCKWVRLRAASIVGLTTSMTGELFQVLREHSLLSRPLSGAVEAGPAFLSGVADGAKRDLGSALFAVRARGLLGLLPDADAASYASGVLIGSDVGARVERGADVHIVGDPALGALYAAAVRELGGTPHRVDDQQAFAAGISRIWTLAA